MHGNDTEKEVFFYEHEFYVFSNFSSFAIEWKGKLYPTSEHVYQSEKFEDESMKEQIRNTRSAHDAAKMAEANRNSYRKDWGEIRLQVMKEVLQTKVAQHSYVKKKLLQSGSRELIEDSWRDDFWGWGEHKNGKNHLGKLWMEIREQVQKEEVPV